MDLSLEIISVLVTAAGITAFGEQVYRYSKSAIALLKKVFFPLAEYLLWG
jgi:hypothetical protein